MMEVRLFDLEYNRISTNLHCLSINQSQFGSMIDLCQNITIKYKQDAK